MIRTIKDQFVKRLPRAVAAYHALRGSTIAGRSTAQRTADGFMFAGPDVMLAGDYEQGETDVIRRFLKDKPVFVDVGANAGYFVCLARHFGSTVIAIEPAAGNLELLYSNLAINGWHDVEVFPLGLSSVPQIATLYGSGTAASLLTRWAGTSEVIRQTIPLSTLDIILGDRFRGETLLIKVDVEGAEFDVVKGAAQVLKRAPRPVWVVEVCLTENHAAGLNPHFEDVFETFRAAGYEARPVDALNRLVSAADVNHWVETGRRDFGYVGYVFADPGVFASAPLYAEPVAAS